MKWLTIIFSFYLLTLSCMPCLCDDLLESNIAKTEKKSTHEKAGDKEDSCNPFCSCSCCPTSVFCSKTDNQLLMPVMIYPSQKYCLSDQSLSSYKCHNIWQPPKLSC